MNIDERLQVCDREFRFQFFIKSPLRFACRRIFPKFNSGAHIDVHRSINIDVLDRPGKGIFFPEAEKLISGPVWELSRKDPYLFLQVVSPSCDGDGLEAIICPEKNKVKVFVDTPWVGQRGFFAAWDLLFQIVFRASLKPQMEQLVNGLAAVVDDRVYLIATDINGNTNRLLSPIAEHFPILGENHLLLRWEDEPVVYSTPWTRYKPAFVDANVKLEGAILFKFDSEIKKMSNSTLLRNFSQVLPDQFIPGSSQGNILPLQRLSGMSLPVVAPRLMASELLRIVRTCQTPRR